MDAYAPCPCGSGKKFKWCCQPFWGEIAHVNKLNENHQYEAALAAIEQLTRKHPQNAEIWGRYAKQLWMMDRGAEAEAALDRALAANPRYAQGYLHKGTLRFSEMDLESAVGLFRKAAELTAPGDVNWLTLTLLQVCRVEYLLGRFLAAFTALDTAQRLAPNLAEAQELRQKFVANQHLLPSMQQSGAMRPAPAGLPAAARQVWERASSAAIAGRFDDARRGFEGLAFSLPREPAVHWNLGLLRAWLGDYAKAIDALEMFVRLEPDEEAAAAGWHLAETLRHTDGLEELADFPVYWADFVLDESPDVLERLARSPCVHRPTEIDNGRFYAELLDRPMPPPSESLALFEAPVYLGPITFGQGFLRLECVSADARAKAQEIVLSALSGRAELRQSGVRAGALMPALMHCVRYRFPQGLAAEQVTELRTRVLRQALAEDWWNQPWASLGGLTPAQAAARPTGRKKVLGLIQFWAELLSHYELPTGVLADLKELVQAVPVDAEAVEEVPARDFANLSADELRQLDPTTLPDAELVEAYRVAHRLGEFALVRPFAEALLQRPAVAGGPEPFHLLQHLITGHAEAGQLEKARHWLEAAGKQADGAGARHGAGLAMLKARVLVAERKPQEAYDVFVGLLRQEPANLDAAGRAAELMLKLGQRAQAAQFAEHGLGYARAQGDRDRQGFFSDLLKAAKKG